MKSTAIVFSATCLLLSAPLGFATNPHDDMQAFRQYFQDRYPDTPFDDFQNGVYAIDSGRRRSDGSRIDS